MTRRTTASTTISTETTKGQSPGRVAGASRARSRRRVRRAEPDGEDHERADDLVRRTTRRRSFVRQLLGDLGLELGQDVGLVSRSRLALAHGRSPLASGSVTVRSAGFAEVDAVLLDEVGVALLVLLQRATTSSPEISSGVRLFCLLNSL